MTCLPFRILLTDSSGGKADALPSVDVDGEMPISVGRNSRANSRPARAALFKARDGTDRNAKSSIFGSH